MYYRGFDRASIDSNGPVDDYNDDPLQFFTFPDDYFVKGIEKVEEVNDIIKGKEVYGGNHNQEYLVCTWKNGKKTGEGLLYDQYGELKFRGTFVDDYLDGPGYVYKDGVCVCKVFYNNNKRDQSSYIIYTETSIYMEEHNSDGFLIYRGGFNDDRQREGYGAEYVKGQLSSYGLYENNVSIQRIKTFSGSVMREYNMEVENDIIYVGGFKDSIEDGFPREGDGREFNESCLLFHGSFKNNLRHGQGTLYYMYGIARLKGVWKDGVLIEEHPLDKYGFYQNVKFDGRSMNSIHIINDKMTLSSRVEVFRIGDKMCNGDEIKRLVLKDMDRIKKISIGRHCFSYVVLFEVSNLSNITSIEIGRDSFTMCDRVENRPCDAGRKELCKEADSHCYINNCRILEKIQIEEGSFSSFCELALKNLPQLEILRIGVSHITTISPSDGSYCFYWATSFSLQDFPSLEYVEIGCYCFNNSHICLLEKLPHLTSFSVGFSAFSGLNDKHLEQVVRFNETPLLALVTIGIKAFYHFHELVITKSKTVDQFSLGEDAFFLLRSISTDSRNYKAMRRVFKNYGHCEIHC